MRMSLRMGSDLMGSTARRTWTKLVHLLLPTDKVLYRRNPIESHYCPACREIESNEHFLLCSHSCRLPQLLPVELSGFRVHMIVKQDEDAQRIPKHINKGLKNKAKNVPNVELTFTQLMQKKMLWFQFHMNHICPVHHLEKRMDGTQINVVDKRFLRQGAGVYMIVQCLIIICTGRLHGSNIVFVSVMLPNVLTSSGVTLQLCWRLQ